MPTADTVTPARSADSFKHTKAVYLPMGVLDSVLAWCKMELTDTWRWQLIELSASTLPGKYVFYFDSDRDFCAFAIKWC